MGYIDYKVVFLPLATVITFWQPCIWHSFMILRDWVRTIGKIFCLPNAREEIDFTFLFSH